MKNRSWGMGLANVFAIVLLASALNAQTPVWKGKISKDGDITVVQNPKEPIYKGDVLVLKEELTIGGGNDPNQGFGSASSLDVGPDGTIYVVDGKDCQVKVFDKTGRAIMAFGKKGQGPGEFQYPLLISVCEAKKEIYVSDVGQGSVFGFDGRFLRKVVPKSPFSMARADASGNICGVTVIMGEGSPHYEIQKTDPEGRLLAVLGKSPGVWSARSLNLFAPIITFEVLEDGAVAVGFPVKYEIEIFGRDQKVFKRIIREYDPVEITKEEKDSYLKDRAQGPPLPAGMTMSFPKYHSAYARITHDDEGRLFVRTWKKTFDVFDGQGRYWAEISPKARPTVWKAGKAYAIEEDEEGYSIVKRYAVIWKVPKE